MQALKVEPGNHSRGFRAGTLAALLLVSVGAGCRGAGRDAPMDTGVAAVSAPAVSPTPDPVPPAVAGIGHHAENAYDMAKSADWVRAQAATDSLARVVAMLPDSGAGPGAEDGSLRRDVTTATETLRRAVTARDGVAAQRAANRLTELGARLSDPYGPRVPASVTLLDYYGREIELWAAATGSRSEERLRETASAVQRTWDELRPRVIAGGGASEAARFDSLVVRLSAARARADYARLATPILDEVDLLERVFTR